MRKFDYLVIAILQVVSGGCMMEVDDSRAGPHTYAASLSYEALTSPGSREVTVASSANAKCELSSVSTGIAMPVWADDSGVVHLWTGLVAPGGDSNEYILACDEPTGKATYNIDLGDDASFSPAVPKVARTGGPASISPLPNPETATPQAVTKAGFPPRPPKESPLYRQWLSVVSRPLTKVTSQPVVRTDVTFGPATNKTSSIWAGLALNKSATRYSAAAATFKVPTNGLHLANATNAAFWAGLGGINVFDEIIQAGTFYSSNGFLGQYQGWLEFFPGAPNFFNNFVRAGDTVFVEVWEGDAACNFGLVTGFACFFLSNQRTGEVITAGGVADTSHKFTGNSCEGAVERQEGTKLAQWSGSAQMTVDCWDIAGGYRNFNSDPYLKTRMINTSNETLAQASQASSDVLSLTWVKEK